MRISEEEAEFLKGRICKLLADAKVYLFGSRAKDEEKGGDIDILVLSSEVLSLKQKLEIKSSFYLEFGEQKLDLISFRFDDKSNFKDLVVKDAIELS